MRKDSNKSKLIPEYIWFNGEIVPWEKATIHVWTEGAIRGANVFDSIRGYWDEKRQEYGLVLLEEHIERLLQSAKLLKFPAQYEKKEIIDGVINLIRKLDYKDHIYIRPTIYIESGKYEYDIKLGMYIVVFPVETIYRSTKAIRCCVSSWKRLTDNIFSPLIKSGAAYLIFRLSKNEAIENGYDDAIVLNENGSIAETTGATIFLVKNHKLLTPSLDSNILDGITRKIVIKIAKELLDMEVEERRISRSELYCADEIFLCGTLCEILPVVSVDNFQINEGKIGMYTRKIQDKYFQICLERENFEKEWASSIKYIV